MTSHSGLPFDVLTPGESGRLTRAARRVDRTLVRLRPTLFAYQFVYELAPTRPSVPVVSE